MTADPHSPATLRAQLIRWVIFAVIVIAGIAALGGILWWVSLPNWKAIAKVEAFGATVNLQNADGEPIKPNNWDASILGGPGVKQCTVSVSNVPAIRPFGDEDLRLLWDLPPIIKLSLVTCPITDEGLAEIALMQSLESLNLDGTKVTQAGLAALEGHPNLLSISTMDTGITVQRLTKLVETWPNTTDASKRQQLYSAINRDYRRQFGGEWQISTTSDEDGETFSRMHIRGARQLPDELPGIMGQIPNIEEFELSGMTPDPLPDELFGALSRCKSLRSLKIDHPGLKDHHLGILSPLTKVTQLSIRSQNVTNVGLSQLRNFSGLQECTLMSVSLEGPFLPDLSLENLEGLQLYWYDASSRVTVRNAARLPSLRRFAAIGPTASVDMLKLFSGNSRIGSLHFRQQGTSVHFMQEGKGLHIESGNNTSVKKATTDNNVAPTLDELRQFEAMTSLGSLWLDNDPVNERLIQLIARLPSLKELQIETSADMTDEGIAPLGNLGELTRLSIRGDDLSQLSFDFLMQLQKLERLSIHSDVPLDPQAETFADLPALTSLRIGYVIDQPTLDRLDKRLPGRGVQGYVPESTP